MTPELEKCVADLIKISYPIRAYTIPPINRRIDRPNDINHAPFRYVLSSPRGF